MNLIFTLDKIENDKASLSNHEQEKLEIKKENLPKNLNVGDQLLVHLASMDKESQENLAKQILNTALNADEL